MLFKKLFDECLSYMPCVLILPTLNTPDPPDAQLSPSCHFLSAAGLSRRTYSIHNLE